MLIQKMVATIFFGICILFANPAFASTISVDQSGGGDYTTIQEGINNAYADDTVTVAPGTYEESVVINKNLTLIGSGPNYTTIRADDSGISVNTNLTVTIIGFAITAGTDGVNLDQNGITATVKNCIISGCGRCGIYINRKGDFDVSAINNTIISNSDDGIHLDRYYSYGGGVCKVFGNIIAFNNDVGIYTTDLNDTTAEFISYNNVYSNGTSNYDGCTPDLGNTSENPQFVDKDTGNYVLLSGSGCINTGRTGATYNDPDGTRNDMGAYAGPDSVAFWPYIANGPVVTNMSINPGTAPKGSTITITAEGRVQ